MANDQTTASTGASSTLTAESLTRMLSDALAAAPSFYREPDLLGIRPLTFAGLRINEIAPDIRPVLQLSDNVAELVGKDFAREMNAWLLEMFGSREVAIITQGTAYMSTRHTAMVVNIRSPQ